MNNLPRIKFLIESINKDNINSYEFINESSKALLARKAMMAKQIVKDNPAISESGAIKIVELFGKYSNNLDSETMNNLLKNPKRFLAKVKKVFDDDKFIDYIIEIKKITGDEIDDIIRDNNDYDEILDEVEKMSQEEVNEARKKILSDFHDFIEKRRWLRQKGAEYKMFDLTDKSVIYFKKNTLLDGKVILDFENSDKKRFNELKSKGYDVNNVKNRGMLLVDNNTNTLNEDEDNDSFIYIHRNSVYPPKFKEIIEKNNRIKQNLENLSTTNTLFLANELPKKDFNKVMRTFGNIDNYLNKTNKSLSKYGLDVNLDTLNTTKQVSVNISNSNDLNKLKNIYEILIKFDFINKNSFYSDQIKLTDNQFIIKDAKINLQRKEYGNRNVIVKFNKPLDRIIKTEDFKTIIFKLSNNELAKKLLELFNAENNYNYSPKHNNKLVSINFNI